MQAANQSIRGLSFLSCLFNSPGIPRSFKRCATLKRGLIRNRQKGAVQLNYAASLQVSENARNRFAAGPDAFSNFAVLQS
jgi:hypothetical protein